MASKRIRGQVSGVHGFCESPKARFASAVTAIIPQDAMSPLVGQRLPKSSEPSGDLEEVACHSEGGPPDGTLPEAKSTLTVTQCSWSTFQMKTKVGFGR